MSVPNALHGGPARLSFAVRPEFVSRRESRAYPFARSIRLSQKREPGLRNCVKDSPGQLVTFNDLKELLCISDSEAPRVALFTSIESWLTQT